MQKPIAAIAALVILTTQISACAPGFVRNSGENTSQSETKSSDAPITGAAEISLESAKTWAKANNSSEMFVTAAESYWKYGEITGIRPEVLYAQAALETSYGNFGGAVTEDMNNFAGIKKADAVGMERDDHETFPTIDDGVRAHFNHMCAYVGTEPVGEVHGRYNTVKRLSWAGTIKTVGELSGKWCPNPDYGDIIATRFLNEMYKYQKG